VTSWQGVAPINFSLLGKFISSLRKFIFQKYKIWAKNPPFGEFTGIIKYFDHPYLLCRKFAAVCWKTATSCPPQSVRPQADSQTLDLHTTEGWKAELTLVVGYIPRWFTCPQTVTHPRSNHLIVTRPGAEPTTC